MTRFLELRTRLLTGLGCLLCVGLGGCLVPPIPRTAQQGSTMVVPAGNENETKAFGGSQVVDLQRGQLRYYLDDPATPGNQVHFTLDHRATSLVGPHPASKRARESAYFGTYQALSVVDIPVDAPLGLQALYVRHEPVSGPPGTPRFVDYLEILPNVVDSVVGKSTPLESSELAEVIPDPQIIVSVPVLAHAMVVVLGGFDSEHYELLDAFESDPLTPSTHRALAWTTFSEIAPHASFVSTTGSPFSQVSFAFRAVEPEPPTPPPPPLIPENLEPLTVVVFDENGAGTVQPNFNVTIQ